MKNLSWDDKWTVNGNNIAIEVHYKTFNYQNKAVLIFLALALAGIFTASFSFAGYSLGPLELNKMAASFILGGGVCFGAVSTGLFINVVYRVNKIAYLIDGLYREDVREFIKLSQEEAVKTAVDGHIKRAVFIDNGLFIKLKMHTGNTKTQKLHRGTVHFYFEDNRNKKINYEMFHSQSRDSIEDILDAGYMGSDEEENVKTDEED